MLIDFDKSWHWGITKEFRDACLDLALLFPSGDIPIKVESRTKDLGERFHYNKSIQLGHVKEKIAEAENCLKRIKSLPLDIQTKAKLIQSAVWPMALYSADTSFLGMTHFQALRSAALFAFLHWQVQLCFPVACLLRCLSIADGSTFTCGHRYYKIVA